MTPQVSRRDEELWHTSGGKVHTTGLSMTVCSKGVVKAAHLRSKRCVGLVARLEQSL